MKDTHYPLRRAIYTVLNNNIIVQGTTIGIYDEKKKVGANDRTYCIFGTQQSTRDRTSEYWITRESIDIEIYQKTDFEVTKDFVDQVSDAIYSLLMPDPINAALPNPSLMQIQHFELERAISRTVELMSTETVIQKIATFTCLIVQQNP
jgi:hypothetical protein